MTSQPASPTGGSPARASRSLIASGAAAAGAGAMVTGRRREITFLVPPTPAEYERSRAPSDAFEIDDSSEYAHTGSRLAAPRMSLLGKPLSYRATRRDARYRRVQSKLYNFLERPRGTKSVLYHMIVFLMVFMCLALSVFSTIDEYEVTAGIVLFYMETVVVIWFAIEFILRLWSSGCRSRYQGSMGRLKFLRRPFCIIDVVTILASLVVLGMGSSGQVFAASALRGLRFFQILRMVRMDRRGGTWKLLGSVVYAHRQELITTLYIGFLGLIFASFLVYLAEKDVKNSKFNNFAQALWWGVITLCTVGYGDMVPETWQGKIIASFCALLGISFFALPAGILGSGFALKVQQQQRQKHMIRRRQPAATLIQALWRCYAADEHSVSIATWKIHQVPLPSPPSTRNPLTSSFKHNASFVSRLPTIRRHKSTSLHSPAPPGKPARPPHPHHPHHTMRTFNDINASAENLGVTNGGAGCARALNASHSEDSVADTALSKKNSDGGCSEQTASALDVRRSSSRRPSTAIRVGEASALPLALAGVLHISPSSSLFTCDPNEDEEPRCVTLTPQHKAAIRFIRKMTYFVAKRKFKKARKPYDVKDVIEQYSAGHVDMLGRVKNVQTRIDTIRKTIKHVPVLDSEVLVLRFSGQQLKYFLARKRFREALKPYDVKDVIEQYSSGHADLLNRTKNLQYRLDQILGKQGSKSKDVYASKISLASRVVKIERQVDDIENKLDQLLEMYLEERRERGGGRSDDSPPGPTPPSIRPRPILVDNKQFSEPNSPVARIFQKPSTPDSAPAHSATPSPVPKRPMNRGFSDLGTRVVRKKVTLKSIGSRDGEVVIVVPSSSPLAHLSHPLAQHDDLPSPRTDSSEAAEACAGGECDLEAGTSVVTIEGGSSGSCSWVDGYGSGDGSGDADSLANEDAALLGPALQQPQPRIQRARRDRDRDRADVTVDLHLLRPDA